MKEYLKALPTRTKALILLGTLIAASALYGWYHETPQLPQKQFAPVAALPQVKNVPKEEIKPAKVVVYQKAALAKKVALPPEVLNDGAKHVTATADLPPSKGGTEVISVIDEKTGESTIFAKAKPLPLFGFANEKKLGLAYGASTLRGPEARLYGEYTFARVGNVYMSVRGEVNNRAEATGLVTAEYRFPN